MSTMGDILITVGRYHDKCGGISWYHGDMMHVGNIMSTVGGYVGDIMSTVGCSAPWGTQITKEYPHGTEHPPQYP